MSANVKAIMILAITLASMAALVAVFIIVYLHSGLQDATVGLGLMVPVLASLAGTVVNIVRTEQLTAKVTNGLIPQKVTEALQQPEAQAAVQDAVAPVLTPVVQSQGTTQPVQPN